MSEEFGDIDALELDDLLKMHDKLYTHESSDAANGRRYLGSTAYPTIIDKVVEGECIHKEQCKLAYDAITERPNLFTKQKEKSQEDTYRDAVFPKLLEMAAIEQEGHLKDAIDHLNAYLQYSSISSRLAIPSDVDIILVQLEKVYEDYYE